MASNQNVAIGVGLLVLLIAVLSPFFFVGGIGSRGQLSIIMFTLLWSWSIDPVGPMEFYIHYAWTIAQYFPFVCFRPPFAYLMIRYYEGKTTGERLIMAGLLGEVPPCLVTFMSISLYTGAFLGQFVGPLPLHLLTGLILVKLKPPPTISSPWDSNE
ncbi:MAG: hypothetical protein EAX87_06570 [Candidatus Thorarchaeota archaeon]|nr:hypothetical protein [Candidatus Thorarchaeota archaeon]